MGNFTSEDIDIMARTIWGEARGEILEGKVAVALVIRNRAEKGGWWGDSITKVCLKPWQFSAWNQNDPNREKLLQVTIEDDDFKKCLYATALVLGHIVPDFTQGSTHYHTLKISPKWKEGKTEVITIGNHAFYNDID